MYHTVDYISGNVPIHAGTRLDECHGSHVNTCGEESMARCLQLYNSFYLCSAYIHDYIIYVGTLCQSYRKMSCAKLSQKVFGISTDGTTSSYYVHQDNGTK